MYVFDLRGGIIMSKGIVFKVLIVLSLFLSSLVFYSKTTAAALFSSYTVYNVYMGPNTKLTLPLPQGSDNNFDPSSDHWFYPSSQGGNTDLNIYIEAESRYYSGDYMVYLQRAVNGSWVTVAHAGFPRNGTKSVNFTSEYNNSYLFPTTPYRFLIYNNDSSAYFTLGSVQVK